MFLSTFFVFNAFSLSFVLLCFLIIEGNFFKNLILFEICFFLICLYFCGFSFFLDDICGEVFCLFILSVVAVESALILSLFMVYFRLTNIMVFFKPVFLFNSSRM